MCSYENQQLDLRFLLHYAAVVERAAESIVRLPFLEDVAAVLHVALPHAAFQQLAAVLPELNIEISCYLCRSDQKNYADMC